MDKKKIRNIIELFIAWNGETEPIDIANLNSAVEFIGSSLQEEPKTDWIQELQEKLDSLSKEDFEKVWAKYKLQEEPVNYDKLNAMLNESLSKETKERWNKRLGEESVSEDLEEAAKRYATEGDEISGLYIIDEEVDAFKAGAKWQKKRDYLEWNGKIGSKGAEGTLKKMLDEMDEQKSAKRR